MATTFSSLAKADARNILRDATLRFFLLYPPLLALTFRFLVPWMQERLVDTYDITPLYPLITGLVGLMLAPTLAGIIIGFLLLDERDTHTLAAMQVTPMPVSSYLVYKLAVPTILAGVLSIFMTPLLGLVQVDWLVLVWCALLGALTAPIMALILVDFAANKVQGLVIMKGASLLLVIPLLAWFVPEPWQWPFGVFPTYWPMKAFLVSQEGGAVAWILAAGFIVAAIWIFPLLSRFRKIAFRSDW